MALIKCKECGQSHTDTRPDCPHCGFIRTTSTENETLSEEEQKKEDTTSGFLVIAIIVVAAALVFMVVKSLNSNEDDKSTNYYTTQEYKNSLRNELSYQGYVHKAVNIRSKPSTDSEIVTTFSKGESFRYYKYDNYWHKVLVNLDTCYIYSELVKDEPLPRVQITTWKWEKDRDFGTNGAIIWNIEVENNTNDYISMVKAEITIYDYDGRITTSDYTYVKNINPFGRSSAKSYADYYGSEHKATVKITEIR